MVVIQQLYSLLWLEPPLYSSELWCFHDSIPLCLETPLMIVFGKSIGVLNYHPVEFGNIHQWLANHHTGHSKDQVICGFLKHQSGLSWCITTYGVWNRQKFYSVANRYIISLQYTLFCNCRHMIVIWFIFLHASWEHTWTGNQGWSWGSYKTSPLSLNHQTVSTFLDNRSLESSAFSFQIVLSWLVSDLYSVKYSSIHIWLIRLVSKIGVMWDFFFQIFECI